MKCWSCYATASHFIGRSPCNEAMSLAHARSQQVESPECTGKGAGDLLSVVILACNCTYSRRRVALMFAERGQDAVNIIVYKE